MIKNIRFCRNSKWNILLNIVITILIKYYCNIFNQFNNETFLNEIFKLKFSNKMNSRFCTGNK